MPKVEVNGTSLEYVEEGTGQPVVFVHGSTGDLRMWSQQMDVFATSYRAIAVSCRHYHPNDEIPDGVDLPMPTLVDDLAALLRELNWAPAHVVGQSSGAFVCLLLGAKHPDLLRTLVLAEPPVMPLLGLGDPPKPHQLLGLLIRNPGTGVPVIRFGMTIVPTERAFARGDDERGLRTFFRGVMGHQAFAELPTARWQQARENIKPFKAQMRVGFPPFGEEDARRVGTPTLLVTGERSAPVLHRLVDRLQQLMPRAQKMEIRNASHFMHEDRPQEFNERVLAFLARN